MHSIDAVYCYRLCGSDCLSVTLESPIKTAELIKMPFGMGAQVDTSYQVLDLSDDVFAWLSVWSEVQITCIWSSWCQCHPIISASQQNSE